MDYLRELLSKNGTVMDFGCGKGGVSTDELIMLENKNITGIDVNCQHIEEAKKRYQNNEDVSFLCINLLDENTLNSKYDLIVSRDVFEVFDHQTKEKAFMTLLEYLNEGGVLVLSDFRKNVIYSNLIMNFCKIILGDLRKIKPLFKKVKYLQAYLFSKNKTSIQVSNNYRQYFSDEDFYRQIKRDKRYQLKTVTRVDEFLSSHINTLDKLIFKLIPYRFVVIVKKVKNDE